LKFAFRQREELAGLTLVATLTLSRSASRNSAIFALVDARCDAPLWRRSNHLELWCEDDVEVRVLPNVLDSEHSHLRSEDATTPVSARW
jgi:hypothetical protein